MSDDFDTNGMQPQNTEGLQAPPARRRSRRTLKLMLAAVLTAVFALTVIVVGAVLIRGVDVVKNDDGSISFVLRAPENGNPFAVAATSDRFSPPLTEFSMTIKDPPSGGISTTPVENEGELTIPRIAEKVKPSVVGVMSTYRMYYLLGSGVILTDDGYIVTNCHVVSGASAVTVFLDSGEKFDANVIGADESSDLAVLKIEAENLTPATFGNSDALEVGDLAVVIGTPYDLSLMGTTTAGIISAINRDIVINNRTMSLIQTDASINSGNSGGALVNKYGQVVGIPSLKIGQDYEGIGFAIPMNTAKPIIEELITYGRVTKRPALGVSGQFLTSAVSKAYGLPTGLYVSSVYPTSDAYVKGVRAGDIITEIDGVALNDVVAYNDIKNVHKAGDTITITVYRDNNFYDKNPGAYLKITIVLIDESELG